MRRLARASSIAFAAFALWLTGFVTPAGAADFAMSASPPRFELTGKPGEVLRSVVEFDNATPAAARLTVKTADWTLDPNSSAVFSDALAPDSCRPWVSIERREITIPARGQYRYRFEVTPPQGAIRGECRFGLLIEGEPQQVKTQSGLTVPVSGRLGVIVYVDVGGARPDLRPVGYSVGKVNGEPTPIIQVKNAGDAHGRLSGFLSGVDSRGTRAEFAPSSSPILAGETRSIPLVIDQPEGAPPIHLAYPITIHGRIQWADKAIPFSQVFTP